MEGYLWDLGFRYKTVQDSGFGCSWETGFAEIGNRMRDIGIKGKLDA